MTILAISTLVLSLLHISELYVLIKSLITKNQYIILFIVFSVLAFIMVYSNIPLILLLLLVTSSIVLVKFSSNSFTIFLFPFLYILNCFLSYIVSFPVMWITGMTIDKLNSHLWYLVLTPGLALILALPLLILLRKLFFKKLLAFFDRFNPKLLMITTITLSACATLIFIVCTLLDPQKTSKKDYAVLISFIVLYSLLTLGMIFVLLKTVKKNYETAKKVEYLENLNKYTENLEVMYNNLRSFKHDYVNIMTSMSGYMEENKFEELKEFFHNRILPMQKNLSQNNDTLNKLQNLKILELKSILYSKVILAVNQNIETVVDIPEEIDSVNIYTVDLTRILGIYMDNAIEAAIETENPIINLNVGNIDNDVVIIISNSFIDKGFSPSQLEKKDMTTKGAGHGLGLYNVSEILKNYNNIYHETVIDNGMFTQQLRIS